MGTPGHGSPGWKVSLLALWQSGAWWSAFYVSFGTSVSINVTTRNATGLGDFPEFLPLSNQAAPMMASPTPCLDFPED